MKKKKTISLHKSLENKIKQFIEETDVHAKKSNLSKEEIDAQYRAMDLEDKIKEENLMKAAYKISRQCFRVLLVDDDKQVLSMNHQFITEECNLPNIHVSENGKDALNRVKKERFDLILSDYRMPEMDGRELKEGLDAMGWDGMFVLVSGYVEPEMKHLKGQDILMMPKPFELKTLFKIVNSAYLMKLLKKLDEEY